MLVTLLILIILIVGVYTGIKRGLLHQLTMTVGFLLSYILAAIYYDRIIYWVEMSIPYPAPVTYVESPYAFFGTEIMFDMHKAFYHFLSFLILLAIGWLITRLIGRLLEFLRQFTYNNKYEHIASGILSFIVHYVWAVLFVFLLTLIPFSFIQNSVSNSFVGQAMVEHTPILSDQLYEDFIVMPIEENRRQTEQVVE